MLLYCFRVTSFIKKHLISMFSFAHLIHTETVIAYCQIPGVHEFSFRKAGCFVECKHIKANHTNNEKYFTRLMIKTYTECIFIHIFINNTSTYFQVNFVVLSALVFFFVVFGFQKLRIRLHCAQKVVK